MHQAHFLSSTWLAGRSSWETLWLFGRRKLDKRLDEGMDEWRESTRPTTTAQCCICAHRPECPQYGTSQPHRKKGKLYSTKTGLFAANQCNPHNKLSYGACGLYIVFVHCTGSSRSIRSCAAVFSQLPAVICASSCTRVCMRQLQGHWLRAQFLGSCSAFKF